jgi:hypothetical protein
MSPRWPACAAWLLPAAACCCLVGVCCPARASRASLKSLNGCGLAGFELEADSEGGDVAAVRAADGEKVNRGYNCNNLSTMWCDEARDGCFRGDFRGWIKLI